MEGKTMSNGGGWNRPRERAESGDRSVKRVLGARHMLLGAVIVIALGAAFFFLFSGGEDAPREKANKGRGRIKAITPTVVPTNKVAEVKKPIDPKDDYDHTQFYRDEHGHLRYMTGCRAPDPWKKPKRLWSVSKLTTPPIFTNASDCAIYSFVTRKPGTVSFDDTNFYSPEFAQEFQRSLLEPVLPQPGDSESDKELKLAVADVKKELCARIKAGENLGDILTETRDNFDRLYKYKEDLEKQVSDIVERSEGSMKRNDVKDLVAAANKMFEEQGLEPIEEDAFISWNIRLSAERNGLDPNEEDAKYEAEKEERENQKKEIQDEK